jgi:hypothetical protein
MLFVLLAASVVRADEPARVLLVDGNGAAGSKKGGGAYYVEAVLKSVKGYAPAVKDAAELEKPDLKNFSFVFLLDVPELPEPARANLEAYVKGGAGVAFFLGAKVRPAHYNRLLYRKGEGIFPVQLASQPTEAPKGKDKAEAARSSSPGVFVRDPGHPLCADLEDASGFFAFLDLGRHFPVVRGKGNRDAGRVQELIALPNEADATEFKEETQKLNRAIPVTEEKYKDFRPGLERHQWAVRRALVFGKKAWELGDALNALLEDRGNPKEADRPDLTEFWRKPEVKELRQQIAALRDKTRYADPIVVAAPFGKGRVVACLTSAGGSWNDWADGPASPTFVMLTTNVAKYLKGGDGAPAEKRPR